MTKRIWIIAGLLAGVLYSWLVTIALRQSLAVAWPEWYARLAEDNERIALSLWYVVVVWVPCLLISAVIGYALIKCVRRAAFAAAVLGAVLSLLYSLSGYQAQGVLSGLLDFKTWLVVALLPLGVLLLQLHNKPLNPDASDAGAG